MYKMVLFRNIWIFIVYFIVLPFCSEGRIHRINLQLDTRGTIDLSSFGYLRGAELRVNVSSFQLIAAQGTTSFALSLEKNRQFRGAKDAFAACSATEETTNATEYIVLHPDQVSRPTVLHVLKGSKLKDVLVCSQSRDEKDRRKREVEESEKVSTSTTTAAVPGGGSTTVSPAPAAPGGGFTTLSPAPAVPGGVTTTLSTPAPAAPGGVSTTPPTPAPAVPGGVSPSTSASPPPPGLIAPVGLDTALNALPHPSTTLPPAVTTMAPPPCDEVTTIELHDGSDLSGLSFTLNFVFTSPSVEGSYDLVLHNCRQQALNITLLLVERNPSSYLSAGSLALPQMYLALSIIFAVVTCVWFKVLRSAKSGLYKTHYLMLVVVVTKSLALLLEGLHYHLTGINGHHEDAFAILYYIIYLLRGSLMLITILLIGAGWTFIKYVFSDREKKIFLIIIPLQILANIASVIVDETEQAESQYGMWSEAFILLDLVCCGAILFPVVWSIRHLTEAANTDGKAAISLQKLRIFRHFYILIVCYIYFSRIIVYLLKMTLPFRYEWLHLFFQEVSTLIFYLVTGYKFRPESSNPYLQLAQEESDEEEETVLTTAGLYENVVRVNLKEEDEGQKEGETTIKIRESSHEYD